MFPNYPELLKKYRERCGKSDLFSGIYSEVVSEMEILKTFQTCLSIGTGTGEYDIAFIKICLPNLKKFIVVDMNPDCVKELKVNLKTAFGDKLEVEIHETTIENFMKAYKGSNIDIAIAFHVLYYLKSEDLRSFFDLCFNSWLHQKHGLLLFAANSLSDDLENINRQFQPYFKPQQYLEDIKDEIKRLGLLILKNFPYNKILDLRECDSDIFILFSNDCKIQLNNDVMKETLKKAVPSGWGSIQSEICVIAKHDF